MSRILRDHRRLVDETMRQAKKAGKRVQDRRSREQAQGGRLSSHLEQRGFLSPADRSMMTHDQRNRHAQERLRREGDELGQRRLEGAYRRRAQLDPIIAAQLSAQAGRDPGIQREMRTAPGEHPATGQTYASFSDETSRRAREGDFSRMNEMPDRTYGAHVGMDPKDILQHEREGRQIDQVDRQLDQAEMGTQAELLSQLHNMTSRDTSGAMAKIMPDLIEMAKHEEDPEAALRNLYNTVEGLMSPGMPQEGIQFMRDGYEAQLRKGEITQEQYRQAMDGLEQQGQPGAFAQATMGLLSEEMQEKLGGIMPETGRFADEGISRIAGQTGDATDRLTRARDEGLPPRGAGGGDAAPTPGAGAGTPGAESPGDAPPVREIPEHRKGRTVGDVVGGTALWDEMGWLGEGMAERGVAAGRAAVGAVDDAMGTSLADIPSAGELAKRAFTRDPQHPEGSTFFQREFTDPLNRAVDRIRGGGSESSPQDDQAFMRENNLTPENYSQIKKQAQALANKRSIPFDAARKIVMAQKQSEGGAAGLGDL